MAEDIGAMIQAAVEAALSTQSAGRKPRLDLSNQVIFRNLVVVQGPGNLEPDAEGYVTVSLKSGATKHVQLGWLSEPFVNRFGDRVRVGIQTRDLSGGDYRSRQAETEGPGVEDGPGSGSETA